MTSKATRAPTEQPPPAPPLAARSGPTVDPRATCRSSPTQAPEQLSLFPYTDEARTEGPGGRQPFAQDRSPTARRPQCSTTTTTTTSDCNSDRRPP